MNKYWKHKATVFEGEKFEIQGINIWDFEWINTNKNTNVKDPSYGESYSFDIYKIQNNNIEIVFAAGEFSNNIWGIYLK